MYMYRLSTSFWAHHWLLQKSSIQPRRLRHGIDAVVHLLRGGVHPLRQQRAALLGRGALGRGGRGWWKKLLNSDF